MRPDADCHGGPGRDDGGPPLDAPPSGQQADPARDGTFAGIEPADQRDPIGKGSQSFEEHASLLGRAKTHTRTRQLNHGEEPGLIATQGEAFDREVGKETPGFLLAARFDQAAEK